jgi:hypothetical protein
MIHLLRVFIYLLTKRISAGSVPQQELNLPPPLSTKLRALLNMQIEQETVSSYRI